MRNTKPTEIVSQIKHGRHLLNIKNYGYFECQAKVRLSSPSFIIILFLQPGTVVLDCPL